MLIVFVSIAILGVTAFIIQRLLENTSNQINTQCIYLAQAGLHDAIYWYRFHDSTANGYFTFGRTNIDANNFFVLGGAASDLLMVDTSGSYIGPTTGPSWQRYRGLYGLNIQNATNSKTITIDRMIVTWNNSQRLRIIRIAGSNLWAGNRSSPVNANLIPDFPLNTIPNIYSINYLRFSGDMRGATISIQFMMTDGSTSRVLTVYPASQNNSFTVKTTGKTTGSNIYRTTQADYNALTGKITNYYEINTEITP
jgi:hypothetical protein